MQYYSLNHTAPAVDFSQATINGQAPDKGLYFPEKLPLHSPGLISDIEKLTQEEIAFKVLEPYTGEALPAEVLKKIIAETISFPFPLVQVTEDIYCLELFHGPTLAFKDVGARFMSRCLGYFLRNNNKKVTVLVATSGDTGGAVANGFYNVEGVDVVILYPKGKVSPVQEKQLTTLGNNITALEVNGTFDDCQAMVKQAFVDADLNSHLFLTSANSINVARWLPQQLYYYFAYRQWSDKNNPPVISVPSGNFGNLCAGILAWHSGLPVKHFIAACNINNVVSHYIETGEMLQKQAQPTLSNAMDVANPSNFVRILEIFEKNIPELRKQLSTVTITDEATAEAIAAIYNTTGYITDPHGAVGYRALQQYLLQHPSQKGLFLGTAHPVKFPEAVEKMTGRVMEVPESIAGILHKPKLAIATEVGFENLKEFLLNK